ncbi:MAG: CopG family antitoxin [Desulfobacterales bacterium]|nr:CopG family antitoxin [Desulfobacterales bacterium]MDZ4210003.1 CopG family antitoxin [Candidatus Curtissbacteria bacterium]
MKEVDMGKSKDIKDMSIYEASDFWDEHDYCEFGDVKETKEIQFSLKKKKYVGIDQDLYGRIKGKAKTLNTSEDALINEWLSEKANA